MPMMRAMMAIKAIEKVAKTDKDGNLYIGKKALRDAVFAEQVRGHQRPDRLRRVRRVRAVQAGGAGVHLGRSQDFRHGHEPEEDLAVAVQLRSPTA